ncbi:MAG: SGNH/GDSL hydrolase family protein [Alishewanella aestuarii]
MQVFWYLVTALLWPLLLWQGKRLRKLAVRLPEAAGDRAGSIAASNAAQQPVLKVLICGDSAAAGAGIASQQQALAGYLTRALAVANSVEWQLVAQSGLCCNGLVKLLQGLPAQRFDQVYVSIGVNNVTALTGNRQYREQCRELLTLLSTRFQSPQIIISAIPPMQQFTALTWPLNQWLGLKARLLNKVLTQELAQWPNAVMVDAKLPLSPELLAADGFHPSAKGAALWAQLLLETAATDCEQT